MRDVWYIWYKKTTSKIRTTLKMKKTSTYSLPHKWTEPPKCNLDGFIVYYLKKLLMTLLLDSHSASDPRPISISTRNKIWNHGKYVKKSQHFRQRHLFYFYNGQGIAKKLNFSKLTIQFKLLNRIYKAHQNRTKSCMSFVSKKLSELR